MPPSILFLILLRILIQFEHLREGAGPPRDGDPPANYAGGFRHKLNNSIEYLSESVNVPFTCPPWARYSVKKARYESLKRLADG